MKARLLAISTLAALALGCISPDPIRDWEFNLGLNVSFESNHQPTTKETDPPAS